MSEAISQITSSLFGTNGAITQVWTWLTSATVLPYFAISIAISLVFASIGIIRKTVWGA